MTWGTKASTVQNAHWYSIDKVLFSGTGVHPSKGIGNLQMPLYLQLKLKEAIRDHYEIIR